jgi:hypothetical protein
MKKPLHGDYLNVRYEGATLRVRCDDITETPNRGVGAANFTIVSDTQFQRGHEAHLIAGAEELPVQVERVTIVGRRRMNIVLFRGVFLESAAVAGAMSVPSVV